ESSSGGRWRWRSTRPPAGRPSRPRATSQTPSSFSSHFSLRARARLGFTSGQLVLLFLALLLGGLGRAVLLLLALLRRCGPSRPGAANRRGAARRLRGRRGVVPRGVGVRCEVR